MSNNDRFLVPDNSSIYNFKNYYEYFVQNLGTSSSINLIKNAMMDFKYNVNENPNHWVGTSITPIYVNDTKTTTVGLNGTISQTILVKKLTKYTLAYKGNVGNYTINVTGTGITDLETNITPKSKTLSSDTYYVISTGINTTELTITISGTGTLIYTILSLTEGVFQFNDVNNLPHFLENISYGYDSLVDNDGKSSYKLKDGSSSTPNKILTTKSISAEPFLDTITYTHDSTVDVNNNSSFKITDGYGSNRKIVTNNRKVIGYDYANWYTRFKINSDGLVTNVSNATISELNVVDEIITTDGMFEPGGVDHESIAKLAVRDAQLVVYDESNTAILDEITQLVYRITVKDEHIYLKELPFGTIPNEQYIGQYRIHLQDKKIVLEDVNSTAPIQFMAKDFITNCNYLVTTNGTALLVTLINDYTRSDNLLSDGASTYYLYVDKESLYCNPTTSGKSIGGMIKIKDTDDYTKCYNIRLDSGVLGISSPIPFESTTKTYILIRDWELQIDYVIICKSGFLYLSEVLTSNNHKALKNIGIKTHNEIDSAIDYLNATVITLDNLIDSNYTTLDDLIDSNYTTLDNKINGNNNNLSSRINSLSSGKVTSVSTTLPLISSGGLTPTISIPPATSIVNGYMTKEYAAKLNVAAVTNASNTFTVKQIIYNTSTDFVLGRGIEVTSINSTGIYGIGKYDGISGSSTTTGNGVRGYCSGVGKGVQGECDNGIGVYGISKNNKGVVGQSTAEGVVGRNTTSNSTVYGCLSKDNLYGVYGYSTETGGYDVIAGSPTGKMYAKEFITASSLRYKTNVNTFENALSTIESLRGVTFDLKSTGKKHIGLIAEEVYEVIPEVVQLDQEGLPESINYQQIIGVLVEAIKELKSEIDILKGGN